eukprot:TRINITY_DN43611_c0_g1_i1.p1 TRINITY_DN43611_c0_g1~~TRINITY_DN43611_c0_g1_i1.p1  ORF type:complete len:479 (-),score=104.01 TRINITY_DN43611_c0_g1_i1:6-1442(-)
MGLPPANQAAPEELNAELMMLYEAATSEMHRLSEELEFMMKESDQQRKDHENEMSQHMTKLAALEAENTSLRGDIKRAEFRLKEGGENLNRLQWKVQMLTSHIESRESKVWSFLFTENPERSTDDSSLEGMDNDHLKDLMASFSDLTPSPFDPKASFSVTDELKLALLKMDFDMWPYNDSELALLLAHIISSVVDISEFPIDQDSLLRFLREVLSRMRKIPFHNSRHVFCVAQMTYHFLTKLEVRDKFSNTERLGLMVAAVCHDLDHPGLTNAYQVASRSKLAMIYNDNSPLENHHCSTALKIINDPLISIFNATPSDELYKAIRTIVIPLVLSTDMAQHFDFVSKIDTVAKEGFSWENASQKTLLMQLLLKSADLSNELRQWSVAKPWADGLLEEFFNQTDAELKSGVKVTEWMKRENVVQSQMQVNFLDHILIPMFTSVAKVLPKLNIHLERLAVSRSKWSQLYQEYKANMEQTFE